MPTDFPRLRRQRLDTLQVNLGYVCNQSCLHCHVNAGPHRRESMSAETVAEVIAFLQRAVVRKLDLTGGAPELNPRFCHLVVEARRLGLHVIDRCNLTVLEMPGQEGLGEFLADQRVEVIASLPCYLKDNVERQRGAGVYDASVRALRRLNALGYGAADSGLILNLVYNPAGTDLPPPQQSLELDYKRHLAEHYGVAFNALYTLTNMPIQRFGSTLLSKGQFFAYLRRLREAHRSENLDAVMCRSLISVDWEGYLYDCDFNQMLALPMAVPGRARTRLRSLQGQEVEGSEIIVGEHCYGCTAGQGSSCSGALAG